MGEGRGERGDYPKMILSLNRMHLRFEIGNLEV
jgi:hypothetical protein